MYTKKKKLILSSLLIGLATISIIMTMGLTVGKNASFSLAELVETSDEIIHLPYKVEKIFFDLRPAELTCCYVETDPQYVPPPGYLDIFDEAGERIEIWAVYVDPVTHELKALHKIIMKEGPYKKFTYWGSGEGPDLVNINTREIYNPAQNYDVKVFPFYGDNCFFGSNLPETTTRNFCLTGDGIDTLVGGPNIDYLNAGEGNDIVWGLGPGQFDSIPADSISGDEPVVPGPETYVP